MHIIVFGNGPLPVESQVAVTAPGGRTWQVVRTIALALSELSAGPHLITLIALDDRPNAASFNNSIPVPSGSVTLRYLPLSYEQFKLAGSGIPDYSHDHEVTVSAVVGCASAQPYSTAAMFAAEQNLPLWIDVFGDPIAEWQTQASTQIDPELAQNQQVHVWKLFIDCLLAADRFSTLSLRQRYALLGQLGCAGRLNQYTASDALVHSIPFGVFPDEAAVDSTDQKSSGTFNILWCGSFNTWMDVDTLVAGVLGAMRQNPMIRLTVVGGQIKGYNEASYARFVNEVKTSGLTGAVQLLDWQPLSTMPALYRQAHIGLSIDRFCYEAHLGSRTRVVNFMANGVPVVSTAISEITEELAAQGLLLRFNVQDAQDLTRVLLDAASRTEELKEIAEKGRQYVLEHFDATQLGRPLMEWIKNLQYAGDREKDDARHHMTARDNDLSLKWKNLRQPLGL